MVGRHAAVIQCVYNLWLQINLSIICSWLMTANNLFSTNSCLFCSAWDIISQSASSFILFGLSERPTHYHTRPRFFLCVFGFTHFVFLFCFHVGIYFLQPPLASKLLAATDLLEVIVFSFVLYC